MFETVSFHQMLVKGSERMTAYRQAIHAAVRPGDVVLDIGSGSGVLALFACQAGASRVYAVEREDIVILAKKLAAENGFADRITFIQDDVTRIELPERVDVITSELISKAMLGQRMFATIGFCRDRFLKPGGRIVPQDVELILAPVGATRIAKRLTLPDLADYGLDFSAMRAYSANSPLPAMVPTDELLGDGQVVCRYDALTSPATNKHHATARFVAGRHGTMNGFCAWFRSHLWQDVLISNTPPGTDCWDNLLFPLPQSVPLEPGMAIEFRLSAVETPAGANWTWATTVWPNDSSVSTGKPIANFSQASFLGKPVNVKRMRCLAADHVITPNQSAEIDRRALELMDNRRTLHQIAVQLREEFPKRYPSLADCLAYVQNLSAKYCESAA